MIFISRRDPAMRFEMTYIQHQELGALYREAGLPTELLALVGRATTGFRQCHGIPLSASHEDVTEVLSGMGRALTSHEFYNQSNSQLFHNWMVFIGQSGGYDRGDFREDDRGEAEPI